MGAFKIAHQNYCDFFTGDVWDEFKARERIGVYYVEERLDVIHRFYDCLINSNKMNELGILYIKHSNLSVRTTVELYNRNKDENKQLNQDTAKSRIIACANKVNNSFERINYEGKKYEALELLFYASAINENRWKKIKQAMDQVEQFIDLFDSTKKNKKEQIIIKIPAYAKVSSLSEDRFNDFMDIIRPYSQREMSIVEECLKQMQEEVGYYNFLLTPGAKLTSVDKERRDTILRWLNMEERKKEEYDFGNDEVIFSQI